MFQRDLLILLQQSTTRVEFASLALMMAELSVFEPEKLTFVSPSPSKEDDIAQRTDSITVNCTADPDRNIMVLLTELGKQVEELKSEAERQKQDQNTEQRNLSKRVKELEKQNQDHIFEHNTGQQNLSKRVEELESRYRDHIFEQRNLRAQVSMLQPIARRILVDVYLSIKGYRPSSSGSRNNWISSNMGMLLPPRTGTTATAFELKLA